jgi:hypothetical protein
MNKNESLAYDTFNVVVVVVAKEDHAAVRSWHDKLVFRFGAGGGGGGCFGNDLIEVARL